MSASNRRVILTFVGWLILTGAQQPAKEAQGGRSAEQHSKAINSTSAPTQPSKPSYRPYPQRYSDTCYNAQDHDAADLCAQWRAAIAAEKAADEARIATIAAIIGTVLSLATVIGLIVTIVQTNGALGEARRGNRLNLLFEKRSRREARKADVEQQRALELAAKSADAAAKMAIASERSNRIARQASVSATHRAIRERKRVEQAERRRLRAYLTISHLQAAQIGTLGEPLWDIQAVWSNNGLTPAVSAITNANLGIFYNAPPPDFDYPDDPQRSQNAPLPVGPSQVLHSKVPPIRGSDAMRLFKREGHAFAWGWIEYQDVFGPELHRTEFSFRLETWHDGKSFQMAFMPYGRHNGIDESCMKEPGERSS